MNIESNTRISTTTAIQNEKSNSSQKSADTSFKDELETLSKDAKVEDNAKEQVEAEKPDLEEKPALEEKPVSEEKTDEPDSKESKEPVIIDDAIDGLKNTVEEMNKLGQAKDKSDDLVKNSDLFDVNKTNDEDENLINNDININEPQKEPMMPQMNASMNFNSQNQAFSEFIQNNAEKKLNITESDLEEENAILSTMDENIAIANKNMLLGKNEQIQNQNQIQIQNQNQIQISPKEEVKIPQVKTVVNDEGVKKVDTKTKITVETVVKFDNVIMNKDDVEFFTQLVENGAVEMDSQAAIKSSKVSKTLADLIAKSMQDNKPVRIDFDNNISVIIKIGKDGKISADFLPSSQVAEAYLKENLPLLRQRFDDNNIDYDSLNQRKQKQEDKNNQKKERKHE